MKYAIETKNLAKKFGFRIVVDSVNLKVPEGSVTALVGENGAGKTTTLSMISGLVRPTLGQMIILGKDISETDVIREDVGVALQKSSFDPHRKALDTLMFYASLKGIKKEDARVECTELLKKVDMEEHAETRIKEMSHGMLKMMEFANALIGDPRVLILDEPASGLDPEYYHKLKELIKGFGKNKTVLLASHNLDFVSEVCDHVAVMHKGKIMIQEKEKKLAHGKALEKVFVDLMKKF
ncbi:ATP-binding cassette domain-containing protein [Candidatus Woesearchaeota archaeon]|nr:ATP-binding cassette domain-containing protein [Candidatus Woesearchaeota archaeon]